MTMERLAPLAQKIAARLTERRETVAIAESSTAGLISTSLLAVPGASAYFLGGAVVYTLASRTVLLGITKDDMAGMRPSTEPYAALLAGRIRDKLGATWGLGETGAAGPSGNRYGDLPGHTCIAIAGPKPHATTLETGMGERAVNMEAFALRALEVLAQAIEA